MVLGRRPVGLRPDNSCCSRLCPGRSRLYLWMRAGSPRARLGVPGFSASCLRAVLRARYSPRCLRFPRLSPNPHPAPGLAARRTPPARLFHTSFRLNAETGAEPLVACCHDEAFPDGDSPYGRIYCDIPGVELGEHCSCNPVFSDGIGCEYSGEERVPFCCWGEIAECCAVGDPPAAGPAQNPWTIPCARCACSPNQSGVGSPSWDPDDAQCE